MDGRFREKHDPSTTDRSFNEGQYVSVEVGRPETEEGWSPYLSLADAEKLDEVRRHSVEATSTGQEQLAQLFKLTPITV